MNTILRVCGGDGCHVNDCQGDRGVPKAPGKGVHYRHQQMVRVHQRRFNLEK